MYITIKIEEGSMKLEFSKDFTGDPVALIERAKFLILKHDMKEPSPIIKPSPIKAAH